MGRVLHVMYLVGVSAFAMSGVLAAHRANMDPFGAMVLAFVASISGGTVREVILDRRPLYWTHDWVLLTVIAATGLATIVFLARWSVPKRTLLVVDALGLAVVTVIGAGAAMDAGVTPPAVIILAVLTGVMGEVLRDILCGEFPPLLLREDVYALAAMTGALCYFGLRHLPIGLNYVTTISVAAVFLLRLCAMYFDWHLPVPHPHRRPVPSSVTLARRGRREGSTGPRSRMG